MGRKRNKKNKNFDENIKLSQQINEEQIIKGFTNLMWDTKQYRQSLTGESGYFGNNVFTPDTLREDLVNLTNNPLPVTPNKISEALRGVPYSAEALQGLVEFMEYVDMTFQKVLDYFSGLLAFDLRYSVKNATAKDYKSKEYKEDLQILNNFLSDFDYVGEFRKVLKEIMRNEINYVWFREGVDGNRHTLQVMPQNFCIATGYTAYGILYDFDMNYFLQPSIDIRNYPPVFQKYFNNVFGVSFVEYMEDYIPSNKLNERFGTFAQYTQTSPYDGAWAFKRDESNFAEVPRLAALMQDVVTNTLMREIQTNKNITGSLALLIGEMKLLDNQKVGNVKNAFAVEPDMLGEMLNIIRNGIGSNNIKLGATPTYENKWFQYKDENPTMYAEQLKLSSGLGVSASRMIYSNDKMSQAEIENAITTDYHVVDAVYRQFEKFLEFNINRKTKKFKFNFTFDGLNYDFARGYKISRILELADRGIVLNESAFASAFGYRPNEFSQMLQEGHSSGFTDKLSSLASIHTATTGDSETKGRPRIRGVVKSESREYDKSKI